MRITYLQETQKVKNRLVQFAGYNHTHNAGSGEFYTTQNLTSDEFPALSPRPPRGTVWKLDAPQGLHAKDELIWADGDHVFYGGRDLGSLLADLGEVFVSNEGGYEGPVVTIAYTRTEGAFAHGEITGKYIQINGIDALVRNCTPDYIQVAETDFGVIEDGQQIMPGFMGAQRRFISMGAYLIVLPDKLCLNTAALQAAPQDTEWERLEHAYRRGRWTISPATLSEEVDEEYKDVITAAKTYVRLAYQGIGIGFERYDSVIIEGLRTVPELNKTCIICEKGDDYVIIEGTVEETVVDEWYGLIYRNVPEMDFVIEQNNRLWGCNSKTNEIYACRLGDPKNWRAYEGLSGDSYAVSCGSDGAFTGAAVLGGYLLFFKENGVHRVYGTRPANFQVSYTELFGIEAGSEKSACVINDVLYYKSRAGVMAYTGALPVNISEALGTERYTNAVAGSRADKYYICMEKPDGSHDLMTYDTRRNIWMREDDTQAQWMRRLGSELYYIDAEGNLMSMVGADPEPIEWMAQTGDIIGTNPNRQRVSRLQLRLQMEAGSSLDIALCYEDGGVWEKVATVRATGKRSFEIPVRTRRSDYLALKLSGMGACQLFSLSEQVEEGSGR